MAPPIHDFLRPSSPSPEEEAVIHGDFGMLVDDLARVAVKGLDLSYHNWDMQ